MIYIDTNAFYLFFFKKGKYSHGVKKVFSKIQNGKEIGITSCLTLDELAYVVLMRLIEKKYKKHPADVIRSNPSVILQFSDKIEKMFDVIFSINNLEIKEVSSEDMKVLPLLMRRYLLLPRDCVHVQTMRKFNCKLILSTDEDFDRVDGITRVRPERIK
jgi:predicted nucleic acid-binding protein